MKSYSWFLIFNIESLIRRMALIMMITFRWSTTTT